MFRNRPVSLALVGLFVWVTACTSWQQIEIAELPDFDEVRVTADYGAKYDLRGPRVESDTLYGLGEYFTAIPISEVAKMRHGNRTLERRLRSGWESCSWEQQSVSRFGPRATHASRPIRASPLTRPPPTVGSISALT